MNVKSQTLIWHSFETEPSDNAVHSNQTASVYAPIYPLPSPATQLCHRSACDIMKAKGAAQEVSFE